MRQSTMRVTAKEKTGRGLPNPTSLGRHAVPRNTILLSAGMAALYLWQERRLKRHERDVLRVRVPPLDALDRLAARSVLTSLALLTLGIGVGAARLEREDLDAAMVVTIAVWATYAVLLVLRHEGRRGRCAALLNLAGFALVAIVLPLTHFAG